MRIAVFSADLVVGEALGFLLGHNGGFDVVALGVHLGSLQAVVDSQQAEIVVAMDDVLNAEGLEALQRLRKEGRLRALLIYRAGPPSPDVARSFDDIHSGSVGVFALCQKLQELAPKATISVESPVAKDLPPQSAPVAAPPPKKAAKKPAAEAPMHNLTPREHEVAGLLAQGMSNQKIAGTLGVSEPTVKVYVGRLLRAMGCQNRVQLALKLNASGKK